MPGPSSSTSIPHRQRSFLPLLTVQRTLYTAQQQLVTDQLSKLSNLITLYKSLGGGWSETG